jgi:hypothetical protein
MSLASFVSAMREELIDGVVEILYQMIDQKDSSPFTSRPCETEILENIFPRLPNLTAITAISDTPWASYGLDLNQFCELLGPDFDPEDIEEGGRRFQDVTLSAKVYMDVLLAARSIQKPLERLVLDPIPIDCWALRNAEGFHAAESEDQEDDESNENDGGEDEKNNKDGDNNEDNENSEDATEDEDAEEWDMILDPSKQELLQTIVTDIQDLRVALTDLQERRYDDLNLARALGQLFGCTRHLRSLDLKWLMYRGRNDDPFTDKWMESFYANTWPHLETLKLQRMNISQSR